MFDEVKNVAKGLFSERELGYVEIEQSTEFHDVGIDSLDLTELVMACEERFDVIITDDEMDQLHNFGELADLVKSKVK